MSEIEIQATTQFSEDGELEVHASGPMPDFLRDADPPRQRSYQVYLPAEGEVPRSFLGNMLAPSLALAVEWAPGHFARSVARGVALEVVPAPAEVPPDDHLQKCNSCGHVRRHSDQTPCPNGQHGRAGWSYAGPIPEPGTAVFIEPIPDAGEEGEPEYFDEGIPSEIQTLDDLFNESEPEEEGPPEEELADDLTSIAVERAIMRMFEVQDRLDAAVEDHAEKADVAKTAKKRVESLQEDLSVAVKAVRQARSARDPDPDRYPLLDGPRAAKDEVNGLFSKPEAVQPLPPDDAEEFYRRKKRDARFADMPFKPKIIEILNGAGYHTVLDLDKLHEAGADITTIRCDAGSITEKRAEDIRLFLGSLAESWVEEWATLHPEDVVKAYDAEPRVGEADSEETA